MEKPSADSGSTASTSAEKRECRCMFCGQLLLLASEEEAIAHMGVCPAMQAQLRGPGPFTLPEELEKRMNSDVSSGAQKKES